MSEQQSFSWTEPVHQAQQVFRTALMALARPMQPRVLVLSAQQEQASLLPQGLSAELAALAYTLCDNETTLWLAPSLAKKDVQAWFRFHCGAVLVDEPHKANFAFVGSLQELPALTQFNQGELAYPDRSTTILVGGMSLTEQSSLQATGPGIQGKCVVPCVFPKEFVAQWQQNQAQFPLGVDMLFCAHNVLIGLPRTTSITESEVKACM